MSETADEFRRFGMQVDLSDPAVRTFMEATGTPVSEWGQFDKRMPLSAPDPVPNPHELQTTTHIPPELQREGVVRADRQLTGFGDVQYTFHFYDGDTLEYTERRGDEYLRPSFSRLAEMINAIAIHRVLPFDDPPPRETTP